jgi:hypothetical protein
MLGRLCSGLALAAAAGAAWAIDPPFEATTRGALCKPAPQTPVECSYSVGRDLAFSIAPVGQPDVAVKFIRSNDQGDYYAGFGVLAGCVVVRHGQRGLREAGSPYAYAFVSPRNGRVYRDWHDCRKAK